MPPHRRLEADAGPVERSPHLAHARALALAALASGCGTAPPAADQRGARPKRKRSPTTSSTGPGPIFAGHPLAATDGLKSYSAGIGDSVYYGDCVSGKGLLGGGGSCLLPLQVTTVIYSPALQRAARPAAQHADQRRAGDRLQRRTLDRALQRPRGDRRLLGHARPRAARGQTATAAERARLGSAKLPPPVYCPGLSGPDIASASPRHESLPGHPCQKAQAALAAAERPNGPQALGSALTPTGALIPTGARAR